MAGLQKSIYSIRCINCQAIPDYTFYFPRTGLVRFLGENSNGKSILGNILDRVWGCRLNQIRKRKSSIRWGHSYAEIIITDYDGNVFKAHIAQEAAETYYELTEVNRDPIRRYLADKSEALHALVSAFGFQYNEKRDMTLHMFVPFTELLFINTSDVVNYDMLISAARDTKVETAIANVTDIMNDLSLGMDSVKRIVENLRSEIMGLSFYDDKKESQIEQICLELANAIESIIEVEIEPIVDIIDIRPIMAYNCKDIVTLVDYATCISNDTLHLINASKLTKCSEIVNIIQNVDISQNVLPIIESAKRMNSYNIDIILAKVDFKVFKAIELINVAKDYDIGYNIESVVSILEELEDLENNVCYVCKKPLLEGVHGHRLEVVNE